MHFAIERNIIVYNKFILEDTAVEITKLSKSELTKLYKEQIELLDEYKSRKLKLDMSRGKPAAEQLDLTNDMLTHCLDGDHISETGVDCRNYGVLDGIYEAKRLFMPMIGVGRYEIIIGGNSSLQLMYDTIARAMLLGVKGSPKPWCKCDKVKWLCPAPGYDRHFAICEAFGMEMITVPMLEDGPDMDMIERLVSEDEDIKGIWCVPRFANPTGVVYSDEVIKRFANLSPKASDFRIYWDDAYCVHGFEDERTEILNILEECKKTGKQDMPLIFASTSKISFPGGGIAAVGASEENIEFMKDQMSFQIIGYDKLNQLRHGKFFKDFNGIMEHMKKHRAIIKPKFELVLGTLERELKPLNVGTWSNPRGGYFVSYNGINGTAKRIVELCRDTGVTLTSAGAAFPYGIDPNDSNIRIAPTYPSLDELKTAIEIFCVAAKVAACEKLLGE